MRFTGYADLVATLKAHGGHQDAAGYWWFSIFTYLPDDKPRVKAILSTLSGGEKCAA